MTQFDQRYQRVETQYNADQITIQQPPLSLTEKQRKKNRTRMLERVESIWIDGVLEPSLQGTAQIALELENKPSAVVTPLWHVLREFDTTRHLSSTNASILQVYDHASGEVLILGEPGAGKTTLLLELTCALLERAHQDEAHPIPVVFPLSSWVTRRQPLTQWLTSELHTRYQVPLPLATSWIETDQVLPLLDGLDEVAAPHRAACVEAINAYRQAHGLLPTVVCSRQIDYIALSTRLLLRTAVVVQPLTPEQIESYLASGGERLEVLRQTLREDADLRAFASTPLMLNVLTAAYQGTTIQEIVATGSLGMKQEQVFDSYVQRMLARRKISTRFAPTQTIHWLSWLARQIRQHNQTVFYIEQMQPDWLSESQSHRIYEHFAVRLPDMLIGAIVSLLVITMLFSMIPNAPYELWLGIIGGLIGGLISGRKRVRPSAEKNVCLWRSFWRHIIDVRYLRNGLLGGLTFGLFYWLNYGLRIGLIYGLVFGLISNLLSIFLERSEVIRLFPRVTVWPWRNHWHNLTIFKHLGVGLSVGLSYGLGYVLSTELTHQLHTSQADVLAYSLAHVLSYTLVGVFISMILEGRKPVIQPAEIIVWSWRNLWRSLINIKHLRNGLLVGLLVGLLIGVSAGIRVELISGPNPSSNIGLTFGLNFGLNAGLTFGLSYWLLFGLYGALSSNMLDERQHIKPNQGIWRSAQNSIFIGLISGLVSCFICSLSYTLGYVFISGPGPALSVGLSIGKSIGLLVGLIAGLLYGLLTGGLAFIEHFILRLLLWRNRSIPWDYPQFLDYAAERILLRKVGGGYIFIHRLLLEYFASLGTPSTPHEEATQAQDASSAS